MLPTLLQVPFSSEAAGRATKETSGSAQPASPDAEVDRFEDLLGPGADVPPSPVMRSEAIPTRRSDSDAALLALPSFTPGEPRVAGLDTSNVQALLTDSAGARPGPDRASQSSAPLDLPNPQRATSWRIDSTGPLAAAVDTDPTQDFAGNAEAEPRKVAQIDRQLLAREGAGPISVEMKSSTKAAALVLPESRPMQTMGSEPAEAKWPVPGDVQELRNVAVVPKDGVVKADLGNPALSAKLAKDTPSADLKTSTPGGQLASPISAEVRFRGPAPSSDGGAPVSQAQDVPRPLDQPKPASRGEPFIGQAMTARQSVATAATDVNAQPSVQPRVGDTRTAPDPAVPNDQANRERPSRFAGQEPAKLAPLVSNQRSVGPGPENGPGSEQNIRSGTAKRRDTDQIERALPRHVAATQASSMTAQTAPETSMQPAVSVGATAQTMAEHVSVEAVTPEATSDIELARLDTAGRDAQSVQNTTLSRPEAARPAMVINQITDAARVLREGQMEITLFPEELGRVRLTMSPSEAGMTVSIVAERMETLELLRRNIDLLAQDLTDQGFENLQFDFGGSDARGNQNFADTPASGSDLGAWADLDETVATSLAASLTTGLDLRL